MSTNDPNSGSDQPGSGHELAVEVSVSTTAGMYPTHGVDRVSAHQKVQVELSKAAEKLKIGDTSGWIATVSDGWGRRTIVAGQTYIENRLSGQVEIDWGPSEGGGG